MATELQKGSGVRGKNDSRTAIQSYKRLPVVGNGSRYLYIPRHQRPMEPIRNHSLFSIGRSATSKPANLVSQWDYQYARITTSISAIGIAIVLNSYLAHIVR